MLMFMESVNSFNLNLKSEVIVIVAVAVAGKNEKGENR